MGNVLPFSSCKVKKQRKGNGTSYSSNSFHLIPFLNLQNFHPCSKANTSGALIYHHFQTPFNLTQPVLHMQHVVSQNQEASNNSKCNPTVKQFPPPEHSQKGNSLHAELILTSIYGILAILTVK